VPFLNSLIRPLKKRSILPTISHYRGQFVGDVVPAHLFAQRERDKPRAGFVARLRAVIRRRKANNITARGVDRECHSSHFDIAQRRWGAMDPFAPRSSQRDRLQTPWGLHLERYLTLAAS